MNIIARAGGQRRLLAVASSLLARYIYFLLHFARSHRRVIHLFLTIHSQVLESLMKERLLPYLDSGFGSVSSDSKGLELCPIVIFRLLPSTLGLFLITLASSTPTAGLSPHASILILLACATTYVTVRSLPRATWNCGSESGTILF